MRSVIMIIFEIGTKNVFHSIAEENAIDRIPIPHQILQRRLPRKGFHYLLGLSIGHSDLNSH